MKNVADPPCTKRYWDSGSNKLGNTGYIMVCNQGMLLFNKVNKYIHTIPSMASSPDMFGINIKVSY